MSRPTCFPARRAGWIVLPILLWTATVSSAEYLHGRVVHVVDGDTLDVLVRNERLRVVEIDAPEKSQPYGNASRQSLIAICGGQVAAVTVTGRDRNGRTLGAVSCAGTDANSEQVRRGMAWVFDRYAQPASPLYAVQNEARDARRGLWAMSAFCAAGGMASLVAPTDTLGP